VLLDAVAGLVNSLPLLYLVDVRHACDWRLAAIVLLFSVRAASAFGPPAARLHGGSHACANTRSG